MTALPESVELYLTDREPTTHLCRYTDGTLIPTVTLHTEDGPVVLNLSHLSDPAPRADNLAAQLIGLAWEYNDAQHAAVAS